MMNNMKSSEIAVIGFDTSAYTTSAAAVDREGRVLADVRKVLDVKTGERGLRQSQALFQHIGNLPEITEQLFAELREKMGPDLTIGGVAVSSRPRPEEGSYMPVFLGGMNTARNIAAALDVPCWEFSHQEGHIAAIAGALDEEQDAMAFHLSGGTGEIVRIKGCRAEEIIGGTLDLSFGQLIDRTGVVYGMGFPAGRELDEAALRYRDRCRWHWSGRKKRVFDEPVLGEIRVKGSYANLSGIETTCQRAAAQGIPLEQAAPELFFRISDAIMRMIRQAAEDAGCNDICMVGGVAASRFLREELSRAAGNDICITFGDARLSSDNAVGTARLGMKRLLDGK